MWLKIDINNKNSGCPLELITITVVGANYKYRSWQPESVNYGWTVNDIIGFYANGSECEWS